MKSRRWWNGPRLQQWKLMRAQGDFNGPLAAFPADSWFSQRSEWLWSDKPPAHLPPVCEYVPQDGAMKRHEAVEKIVENLMRRRES